MEAAIVNSLEQGLLTAFMAMGVLFTFRMMGFPDLTVEGSFPLGGAVAARLLVEGIDPVLATLAAIGAGALAGLASGLMYTRLKINGILAGILTATAIYSIMLRVMGRPNTPLLDVDDLFGGFLTNGLVPEQFRVIVLAAVLVVVVSLLLWAFLHTEIGVVIRATGDNERMVRSFGADTDSAKLTAMAVSNGLVAVSGALIAQYQSFSDVGMGIGALVAAVASIILGETLFGKSTTGRWIIAVVIGSILYRFVINLALRIGLPPGDFRLITAIIVLVALATPPARAAIRRRRLRRLRWRTANEEVSSGAEDVGATQ